MNSTHIYDQATEVAPEEIKEFEGKKAISQNRLRLQSSETGPDNTRNRIVGKITIRTNTIPRTIIITQFSRVFYIFLFVIKIRVDFKIRNCTKNAGNPLTVSELQSAKFDA